jgi:hypothetical protein
MANRIWLTDDIGLPREKFSVGESVFISGGGLKPAALYEFVRLHEGRRRGCNVLAHYSTDRYGTLPAALLMPYIGLLSNGQKPTSIDACYRAFEGSTFNLRARLIQEGRYRTVQTLKLELVVDRLPQIFVVDEHGRLQTGIEQGEGRITVLLRHFPAGCVRIFMVRRQFGWRAGDPIDPVRTFDGLEVMTSIRHDGSDSLYIPLVRAGEVEPGSYQFIARAFRPGWYLADETRMLPQDVVSDRRLASLVIRLPFEKHFDFSNGIVMTPEIAGHPLAHRPYFHFINNFPKGTDVYAALDPDALPQGLASQRAAIYVIEHKSAPQWAVSNALQDITGPNMTPAPKIVPVVPGCINWNTTLVWVNPQNLGRYDIVIDFGNNAANPLNFASDGHLDPPLDMIDGYVRVGFYVTEDPSLPGAYAGSIGQHDYVLGSIQVPSTDAGPSPTDTLPLTATIRYPALVSGIDAPCAAGSFPFVVIMHGNSGYDNSYQGYNYLLEHLASHGFIAMSVYAPVGVMIETRARAILAHLGIMAQNNANPGLFQGHIDFKHVGIAGHSRGAEAVVRAARINTAEALGWHIQAGISIAPTDYHHYGDPGVPLLVIYGSNDGDVAGSWPDRTCFNIYDEAGRPRSFVFVYGATHDRFNTVWAPTALSVESDIASSDIPNLLSMTDHENVAKGYVTAFLQAHLQERDEQLEYFRANLKPSLVSSIQIHTSHQEAGALVLDNFEQVPHDAITNTLGGAVTGVALSTLAEGGLHTLDNHSPHVTGGGEIAWQSTAGIYLSHVPAAAKDVSGYSVLAFRVTQKYGSPQNPTNQPQDLFVRLTDGAGKSRRIQVSTFTDIPYPYVRGHSELIKSAMKSVRIPLASFTIANAGAQDVDLTNIQSVAFEFASDASGEIEIDDVEFSQ